MFYKIVSDRLSLLLAKSSTSGSCSVSYPWSHCLHNQVLDPMGRGDRMPVTSQAQGGQWGGLHSGHSGLQPFCSYAASVTQTRLLIWGIGSWWRNKLFILVRTLNYCYNH